MNKKNITRIADILTKHEADVLDMWVKEQMSAGTLRLDLTSEREVRKQSAEFIDLFRQAVKSGNVTDIETSEWKGVTDLLSSISRQRAEQGFSPSETATFIFSFKQPLFSFLTESVSTAENLLNEAWTITALLDKLGLYTTEVYQKIRNEIIIRQQEELLELSTPVVKLWDGILAVPLIGTLDSERTQIVMESLLQAIVDTDSELAIIDITGVPMVDTLVAQHLLKTVSAARLMGAKCIVSGMRPIIAQTIVQIGIDLGDIQTKSTLANAFELALKIRGLSVK